MATSQASLNIYLSSSNDPYSNLALEQYIYGHTDKNCFALLLYVNAPSVIIGRAQNPWMEVNMGAALKNNIPIARRQSGGGTVFHDLGNINFCFFAPIAKHHVKQNLDCIINALQSLSIPTYQSEKRHQIMFSHQHKEYKLSGSAFRQNKDRAFHHGTLLIDTDLDALEHFCTPMPAFASNIKTKAIASVRSSVTCLKSHFPSLKMDSVKSAICQAYQKQFPHLNAKIHEVDGHHPFKEVHAYYQDLQSWSWQFGHQMRFNYVYCDQQTQEPLMDIQVEKGIITKITPLHPSYQGQCYKKNHHQRFLPLDKNGNFIDILEG